MLRLLGNIVWFVFGGLELGLGWWLAGLLMALSVVGIPFVPACLRIGLLTFWPFGREVMDREQATGRGDIATGAVGCLGNVIWFLLGGWWLALGHLLAAVLYFVTIIGIPFGLQHLKLAALTLAPLGKTIVVRD